MDKAGTGGRYLRHGDRGNHERFQELICALCLEKKKPTQLR